MSNSTSQHPLYAEPQGPPAQYNTYDTYKNTIDPSSHTPVEPLYFQGQQSPPISLSRHQNRPHHTIMRETEDELTEDERQEYEKGVLTWDKARNLRFWFRKEWFWYYIAFVIIVVLVGLMTFFHHDIIDWLRPVVTRFKTLHAGFVIPVAVIFVLSFPPLFGNEIVMILVGVVWGLGKGFAIVAVGTILGELANFVLFKFWCRGRAERMTKKSLNYACLSQAILEGGFIMAFIVRLSVIPTHFTTAVFAVCGLKWYHFVTALILGLPKQLLSVYVGVVLAQQNSSHVVSDCVFAATAVVTIGALWYIYRAMLRVRKKVLIGMRDDLRSKNINVSEPGRGTNFDRADRDDTRGWDRPFEQPAVTDPKYAGRADGRAR